MDLRVAVRDKMIMLLPTLDDEHPLEVLSLRAMPYSCNIVYNTAADASE